METLEDKIQDISGTGKLSGETRLAASAGQENKPDKPRQHTFFRICAVIGLLCAIAGWVLFYHEPEVAVLTGGAGVCVSVAGLWSGRGCLRSLSVTGLVAAGVLVVVYVAFYWGLAWGVSHL